MEIAGRNVLLDGINLEDRQGTGIKVYARSLIQALQQLGAQPHVLMSSFSQIEDPQIDADVFALFNDTPRKPWQRLNLPLMLSGLLGVPATVRRKQFPADLIITRGAPGQQFIDHVGLYASPRCYWLGQTLEHYFGRELVLQLDPPVDVFHATYFTPVQIEGARKVTTVHDIIPLRLPHTTTNDKGLYLRQVRTALAGSQLIIAVSEATRADLIRFFDVDPAKIVVTWQPVLLSEQGLDARRVDAKLRYHGLERQNYILFVGSIEPKKNLRRLIEAYLASGVEPPLVIVGKKAWLWEGELQRLAAHDARALRERVRLLDYVPPCDLPALYKGALALAFPSLYEGFGLPPAEALQFGCPVLTSRVASLPEICGQAALYVDPYDVLDIADKLRQLVEDEGLRHELSAAGRERAGFFSPERYAERLREAYARL